MRALANVSETDEDLMRRYQSGDDTAFAELETRYSDRLTGHFFRWLSLRNLSDANDLAFETWMGVVQSKCRYDPAKGSFRTWIFAIARNVGKDELARRYELQKNPNKQEGSASMCLEGAESANGDATDFEAAMITRIAVNEALLKLEPEQREVLFLHYLEGCTCSEMGQILSFNLEAVKSRLRRARSELLQQIFAEAHTNRRRI